MKPIFTCAIVSVLIASCSVDSPVVSDTSALNNSGSKSDGSIMDVRRDQVYEFPTCDGQSLLFDGTEQHNYVQLPNGTMITTYNFNGRSGAYGASQRTRETNSYPNWPASCPRTWTYELDFAVNGPGGRCCYNYTWVIEWDQDCNVISDVYSGPFDCDGNPL